MIVMLTPHVNTSVSGFLVAFLPAPKSSFVTKVGCVKRSATWVSEMQLDLRVEGCIEVFGRNREFCSDEQFSPGNGPVVDPAAQANVLVHLPAESWDA